MTEKLAHVLELLKEGRSVTLCGLQGSGGAFVISAVVSSTEEPCVLVVRDSSGAERAVKDLSFFLPEEKEVMLFPSWEVLPFEETSPYLRIQCSRMSILRRLARGRPPSILVVPADAMMMRLPPRRWVKESELIIHLGQRKDLEEVVSTIEAMGYTRMPLVEETGDYSIRGGILDIFPPGHEEPVRLEFFGDSVESLRTFSAETQRSTKRIDVVEITPVREIPWSDESRKYALKRISRVKGAEGTPGIARIIECLSEGVPFGGMEFLLPLFFEEGLETLWDYIGEGTVVALEEPDELMARWRQQWDFTCKRARERGSVTGKLIGSKALYMDPDELLEGISRRTILGLKTLHLVNQSESSTEVLHLSMASHASLRAEIARGRWDDETLGGLSEKFLRWTEKGVSVHWVLSSYPKAQRIREHMEERGVPCSHMEPYLSPWEMRPRVWLHVGEISGGFHWEEAGVAFLTEEEVFGPKSIQRPGRRPHRLPSITHLEELKEGDLMVHVDHGIGVYRGLVTLEIGGGKGDFLQLEYLGHDRLYVPVERLRCVHKYVGTEGFMPRLDRLGGKGWERKKRRVRRAVEKLAKELLQLYAAREVTRGHAFSPPDEMYEEFEEAFPFEETPDQKRAIDDVMMDMSAPRPMDRLVCGDVGYGKTEVAMRAAFRAVMDGKQVAVLVPTTILAEQHYETFSQRFEGYPVIIEVLSRFRTPAKQREIISLLREGKVDIVIGTHRLIQRDVEFKDLGLLIIDEEHRFGVLHKERLKQMKKEVDVLTLTATPIPRTLQMAMLGIRDLSLIETPPPERLSIKTVVAPFDREMICEAVERELGRGGQVFFVHNRVTGIEAIVRTLKRWLPHVRIGVAHGQMPERELAAVMERFRGKEIDMLVATTIIQSGLDIPNANTIIIHNAQRLGLAEMYQIRGRVGRSGHQAYAYLLVPEEARLDGDAQQRLRILQEFSELGSGFRVATRDLEIRGAGTLLGPSQSGHVDAVGFELYTRLMRRAIAELKGEALEPEIEPEIRLPIHAKLPENYVEDPHQRLAVYRRLSNAESPKEISMLREEIEDRFGPIPEEVDNLLQVMDLRCLLKAAGIKTLTVKDGRLRITFDQSTPISPQILVDRIQQPQFQGARFLSQDTLEVPLDGAQEQPIVAAARMRLQNLLEGVSIAQ